LFTDFDKTLAYLRVDFPLSLVERFVSSC
jgi:hypothetical protein